GAKRFERRLFRRCRRRRARLSWGGRLWARPLVRMTKCFFHISGSKEVKKNGRGRFFLARGYRGEDQVATRRRDQAGNAECETREGDSAPGYDARVSAYLPQRKDRDPDAEKWHNNQQRMKQSDPRYKAEYQAYDRQYAERAIPGGLL